MTGRSLNRQEPGFVKGLFLFVLLASFCMLSMLVAALGAKVYQTVGTTVEENDNARTSLSYLAGKVRSSDSAGLIRVFDYEGESVLALDGRYGDGLYTTYIFYRDGAMRECFAPGERPFQPETGDMIAKARSFSAGLNGALLTLVVTDPTGKPHSLALCLTAGEEGETP